MPSRFIKEIDSKYLDQDQVEETIFKKGNTQ